MTAAADDTTTAGDRLDQDVVAAAAAVEEAMRADLMRLMGQEAAVVAAAPAGAGKSHFVAATVGQLRAEGLRVALAAPTNDQVQSLVERDIAKWGPPIRAAGISVE